jgi:hypothetical protein
VSGINGKKDFSLGREEVVLNTWPKTREGLAELIIEQLSKALQGNRNCSKRGKP